MFTLILLILASIGAALALYFIAPDVVERWFMRIMRARVVGGAIFTVLLGLVLLMTGSPLSMLLGGALIGLLALGIVIQGREFFEPGT